MALLRAWLASSRSCLVHLCQTVPFVQRNLQFSRDLPRFPTVATAAEFSAQFLDLLFNRHSSLHHLAKDEDVARGGTGRVKDREAAAPAAMGVTIFRGESAASPTKMVGPRRP
ncbi:hypothetical protein [Sphingobium amiense]|uniref:hypothetical protein n=1 Tax=Sphingobium amiense TaxID=135719 RepID=UPI000832CE64|nr:hypothetical protein [Sphingobium amiense]